MGIGKRVSEWAREETVGGERVCGQKKDVRLV